jgi:hypothetical protein
VFKQIVPLKNLHGNQKFTQMKIKLILFSIILSQSVLAQVGTNSGFIFSKEFSKEILLYKAKAFVMKEVFNSTDAVVQFEIDPLATTTSKEVTTLVYRCSSKNSEGLILGFYGDYWNDAGIVNQGFAFKNLPKVKAIGLLSIITRTIEEQKDYLSKDPNNNNVYFQYDDLLVLIYTSTETKIRIFWKDLDAEWGISAFKQTVKKFEKSIN